MRDIDGTAGPRCPRRTRETPGETSDTTKSGAVFYLIPPADRTQKWSRFSFTTSRPPTACAGWDSNGSFDLVVLPLHGAATGRTRAKASYAGLPLPTTQAGLENHMVDDNLHASHNFEWHNGIATRRTKCCSAAWRALFAPARKGEQLEPPTNLQQPAR
ncbi:MAG: hypothetical protein CM1200mP34_1430 [Verrucomicrobiales bacterium]|nr:MAG: hypothetical protein CM1200mP34_1430 [Verrucomicrobiales bacterium]